jgi:hypothetical protein
MPEPDYSIPPHTKPGRRADVIQQLVADRRQPMGEAVRAMSAALITYHVGKICDRYGIARGWQ